MNSQRTKLDTAFEAVAEAHEDVGVDYESRSLSGIAALAAAGFADLNTLVGAVMRAHPHLDPLVQCRLANRIGNRLAFATVDNRDQPRPRARTLFGRQAQRPTEAYPRSRPRDAILTHRPAGPILSVGGRRVGGR